METFAQPISEHLRAQALALPETTEGTSCVNRAFKVRKKNFLFVGEKPELVKIMLKLEASLGEAQAMEDPRIEAAKNGWVTVRFSPDDVPDADLLSAWVVESFRTLGPKSVVRELDQPG